MVTPFNLIKQGAALVENARDVVEQLSSLFEASGAPPPRAAGVPPEAPPPELSKEEAAVLEATGPYPVHIDILVRKLSMDPGALSGLLLMLEIKGLVVQSPGKMFSKKT